MPRGDTNPLAAIFYGLGEGMKGYARGRDRAIGRKQDQKLVELREKEQQQRQKDRQTADDQAVTQRQMELQQAQMDKRKMQAYRQSTYEQVMADIREAEQSGSAPKYAIKRAKLYAKTILDEEQNPAKLQLQVFDLLTPEPEEPDEPKSKLKEIGPGGYTRGQAVDRGDDLMKRYRQDLSDKTTGLQEFQSGARHLYDPEAGYEFNPSKEIKQDDLERQRKLVTDFRDRFPGGAGAQADSTYEGTKDYMTGLPIPDKMKKDQNMLKQARGSARAVLPKIGAQTPSQPQPSLKSMDVSELPAQSWEDAPPKVQQARQTAVDAVKSGMSVAEVVSQAEQIPELKEYIWALRQELEELSGANAGSR